MTAASFGGDADAHLTTVAVALEGVSWSDTELYAACVLHTLMGGGGSFSAGNPPQPEPALFCTKQPQRTSALSKRASLEASAGAWPLSFVQLDSHWCVLSHRRAGQGHALSALPKRVEPVPLGTERDRLQHVLLRLGVKP